MKTWPFKIVIQTGFIILFSVLTHTMDINASVQLSPPLKPVHACTLCICGASHEVSSWQRPTTVFNMLTCTADTQRTDDGNAQINWNWRTFWDHEEALLINLFHSFVCGHGKGFSLSLFFLSCLLLIAEPLCRITSKNSRVRSHIAFSSDWSV